MVCSTRSRSTSPLNASTARCSAASSREAGILAHRIEQRLHANFSSGPQAVEGPDALLRHLNQAGALQFAHVMRHSRLAQLELVGKVADADGGLGLAQDVQDLQ